MLFCPICFNAKETQCKWGVGIVHYVSFMNESNKNKYRPYSLDLYLFRAWDELVNVGNFLSCFCFHWNSSTPLPPDSLPLRWAWATLLHVAGRRMCANGALTSSHKQATWRIWKENGRKFQKSCSSWFWSAPHPLLHLACLSPPSPFQALNAASAWIRLFQSHFNARQSEYKGD